MTIDRKLRLAVRASTAAESADIGPASQIKITIVAAKKRIALVSTYAHLSRVSIERMLKDAFPEFEVETQSVTDVVKRNRGWMAPNLWYVGKEYGHLLARRQMTLREAYLRTTYTFTRLHEAMRQRINPREHLFSFQCSRCTTPAYRVCRTSCTRIILIFRI